MKIKVWVRRVYGRKLVYPMCKEARVLAKIARQDTLTPYIISCIRELGYEVEVVPENLPV